MPKLIAIGPQDQKLHRRLRSDRTVRIGRAPDWSELPTAKDHETWAVPWDSNISRNQAQIRWRQDRLRVERLEQARNPIFYQGDQKDTFSLPVGDHFVIGQTTFRLVEDQVSGSREDPTPVDVTGYTVADLAQTRYQDADERLEVIADHHGNRVRIEPVLLNAGRIGFDLLPL